MLLVVEGAGKHPCSPDVTIHWLRRGGWIYGEPVGPSRKILRAAQGFLPADLVICIPDWMGWEVEGYQALLENLGVAEELGVLEDVPGKFTFPSQGARLLNSWKNPDPRILLS